MIWLSYPPKTKRLLRPTGASESSFERCCNGVREKSLQRQATGPMYTMDWWIYHIDNIDIERRRLSEDADWYRSTLRMYELDEARHWLIKMDRCDLIHNSIYDDLVEMDGQIEDMKIECRMRCGLNVFACALYCLHSFAAMNLVHSFYSWHVYSTVHFFDIPSLKLT